MLKLVFFLGCLVLVGCKPRSDSDLNSGSLKVHAHRVPMDLGEFPLNDQGRFADHKLILSLDFVPDQSGTGRLPQCVPSFSDLELAIGRVSCQPTGPSKPLLLKQVFQECYTKPKSDSIKPVEELNLSGCSKVRVFAYRMTPDLRVDAELKRSE